MLKKCDFSYGLVIGLIVSIFSYYFPILFVAFFILLISLSNLELKIKNVLGCFFIALFFSEINILKLPSSDALVYIEAIKEIKKVGFFEVFNFQFVSLRSTEFIFNIYIYLVSLLDDSGWLFSFLSIFIIYFNLSLSLVNIIGSKYKERILIIFVLILLFVTFSLSGHLVRQYIAISFLLLGVSYLNASKLRSFTFLMMSIFIHNSLLPFVLFYPIVLWALSKFGWKLVTIISVFVSFIASNFVYFLRPYMEIGFVKDDGTIPIVLLTFDFLAFVVLIVLKSRKKHFVREIGYLYPLFLLVFSVLILTRDVPLLFLRFYFMIDFLRPVVFSILFFSIAPSRYLRLSTTILLSVLSLSVFMIRLDASPWDYGGSSFNLLFFNDVLNYIDRIVSVWFV